MHKDWECSRVMIGTRDCQKWSAKIIEKHKLINHYIESVYKRTARSAGYVSANNKLREMDSVFSFHDPSFQYRDYIYIGGSWSVAIEDEDIEIIAARRSQACENIYRIAAGELQLVDAVASVGLFVEFLSISFPLVITRNDDEEKILKKNTVAINKVSSVSWWRRVLRKMIKRQLEAGLRAYGFISKDNKHAAKSAYVSNYTFQRWKRKQRKNKEMLANTEAVNEEGDTINLLACAVRSVSNPEVMRVEWMVRNRGYEEIANSMGLQGLFLTLTCPSKYHAKTHKGFINSKFTGASPADAMGYLNEVWARIRAEWHRCGVRVFGFRVSEPHHDGTPHNHFLLYCHPDLVGQACEIFRRHAMVEDGDEKGASEHRCDVVEIDKSKGTATGYIAKYIGKNLNGYGLEIDEESMLPAQDGAERVKCWASTWGIRQFQPIGSVSVTVWRELRRKREILTGCPEIIEQLRDAADRGSWREFVDLMGGAFVGREQQTARPQYVDSDDVTNTYEDKVIRLIGVWLQPVALRLGFFLSTRDHVWTVRPVLNKGGLGSGSS